MHARWMEPCSKYLPGWSFPMLPQDLASECPLPVTGARSHLALTPHGPASCPAGGTALWRPSVSGHPARPAASQVCSCQAAPCQCALPGAASGARRACSVSWQLPGQKNTCNVTEQGTSYRWLITLWMCPGLWIQTYTGINVIICEVRPHIVYFILEKIYILCLDVGQGEEDLYNNFHLFDKFTYANQMFFFTF